MMLEASSTEAVEALDLPYIAAELRAAAVPLKALRLDPKNHNIHNEKSIKAIAASLQRFGQRKPICALRSKNKSPSIVYAGNGTYEAATLLGWSHIAVVWFDTEAEAKAFALADNQTAKYSELDPELTRQLISELELNAVSDAELLAMTQDVLAMCDEIEAESAPAEEDDDEESNDAAPRAKEQKIVMHYTDDDIDALVLFLGTVIDEDNLGKRLLERIKQVAASMGEPTSKRPAKKAAKKKTS